MLDLQLFTPRAFRCPSLEVLLTSPDYFGLETASPLQRAICRVLDALPLGDLAHDSDVITALGGEAAVQQYECCPQRAKILVLLAGIRSAKSLIAACAVVRAALTCDLSHVRPGEPMPRASVVSTSKDTAQPTWDHIRGHVEASPILRSRLIGEPKVNSLVLRHESDAPVEISVVAGARGASTLVARWSAGVIFDEAPRMVGEEDGVINLDHELHGIAGRMLPGAPIILSGSSWAPFGPVYNMVQKHHGAPSAEVTVIRARSPAMNPVYWTPERCAELAASNPNAYRVDVETEFLDPESGLLTSTDIERCIAFEGDLPPSPGCYYAAAIDPATRGNAWTLVVLEHGRSGNMRIVLARQWIGSTAKPLSPAGTFAEIAQLLAPYAVRTLHTDQWAADALIESAATANLWLVSHSITDKLKLEYFTTLAARVADRTLELPRNMTLVRDLASVRKRATATSVAIHLPLNGAGRHCDYAPAIALVLQHCPMAPESLQSLDERGAVPVLSPEKERARAEVEQRNKQRSKLLGRYGFMR